MVVYIVSFLGNAFYHLVSEIRSNTQTLGNISSCPEMSFEVILSKSCIPSGAHIDLVFILLISGFDPAQLLLTILLCGVNSVVFQAALALLFV